MSPRARLLTGASLALGTFPVAYVARPIILGSFITLCPFATAFNRPCLFCGLTRAFAHATHGEFAAAFALNPLWWLAASLLLIAGVTCLRCAFAGTPLNAWWWRFWRDRPWSVITIVLVGSVLRALLAQGPV